MIDLIIIAILGVLICVFVAFLSSFESQICDFLQANTKKAFFYFRWWLIGRTHCTINPKLKCFWWICHKALWFMIFLCVCYTYTQILGL